MVLDNNTTIGVIGLGYVGLPLAVAFSRLYKTIGYDIDLERIAELCDGYDRTQEVDSLLLNSNDRLSFTGEKSELQKADVFIITVPTPIDKNFQPDLTPLEKASELVGGIIKRGNVVIYESTVYPGATEDVCIPIIEKASGLKYNEDFFAGYSPERINPGDKTRPVTDIIKVTSGSNTEISHFVDALYSSIITAGTHRASSIRVAEASKVIENTQRDVNIALINEFSLIFDVLDLPTEDILAAAATKWNFINLKPGLVGGHCIGVDPYYLLHKSLSAGYVPDIIRRSREINDGMSKYLAEKFIRLLIDKCVCVKGSEVLVLGYTFKENCPDVRNTKVYDLVKQLESYGIAVSLYDPVAMENADSLPQDIKFISSEELNERKFDGIFVAVGHAVFKGLDIHHLMKNNSIIYDFKNVYG